MAESPQPPGSGAANPLPRRAAVGVTSLLVIVLTPFLVFSENSIKTFIDSWLNDCLVVFETENIPPNKVKVLGYVSGKAAPPALPLTFTAHDVLINRIKFTTDVDRPNAGSSGSLALHPLTNAACPGSLCRELGSVPSSPKLTITLKDVSPQFVYNFSVEFDKPATKEKLALFVQYDEGLNGGVCRVEYANVFNFLNRASKWTKFLLMAGLFLVVTVLIGYFRSAAKEGN